MSKAVVSLGMKTLQITIRELDQQQCRAISISAVDRFGLFSAVGRIFLTTLLIFS